VVASPLTGVGHATSREDAMKLIRSLMFSLKYAESKLTTLLEKLEKRKVDVTAKMAGVAVSDQEIIQVRSENAELKRAVERLDQDIRKLTTGRRSVEGMDSLEKKREIMEKLLMTMLAREGILSSTGT